MRQLYILAIILLIIPIVSATITVTQNNPIDDYSVNASSVNITFNCSVNSSTNIVNVSLYRSNFSGENKSNFTMILNQTTNLSGTLNSTNWTVSLPGVFNYTWYCEATNNVSETNISTNRTVRILFPVFPFLTNLSNYSRSIAPIPAQADSAYHHFSKFTYVLAPSGKPIHILAETDVTDEQLIHARQILETFLMDEPGSLYGDNKTNVSNNMANRQGYLTLFTNESTMNTPSGQKFLGAIGNNQDLLGTEIIVEGSSGYISQNPTRDASYEEILHFIQDFGFSTTIPALQSNLTNITNSSVTNGTYRPLNDLEVDDYDNEYYAIAMEAYYGLWAHDPNKNNTAGSNEYDYINRSQVQTNDTAMHNLIVGFLSSYHLYTPTLDSTFTGTFYMNRNASLNYTYKSQYLKNVKLYNDSSNTHIRGNDLNNSIWGNSGNNTLDGQGGTDTVYYTGNFSNYTITNNSGPIIVTDSNLSRDGNDTLLNVEFLVFNDTTKNINTLFSNITISFVSPTTSSGNFSQSFIQANVSINGTFDTTIIYIYNSSGLVSQNSSTTSPYFVNFTSLPDETYFLNATVNSTSGANFTASTRTIVLDTTNPTVSLLSPSESASFSGTTITFNATASDSNLVNVTLYIDGVVNESNTSGTNGNYSFTVSLTAGSHNWSILATDAAGNQNQSITRNFSINASQNYNITATKTVDNTTALIGNIAQFTINITNLGSNLTNFTLIDKLNMTELNFSNASGSYIWNASTGIVSWDFNLSTSNSFIAYLNVTTGSVTNATNTVQVNNGSANITQGAGWVNVVDTINPGVVLLSPTMSSYQNTSSMTFTYNATDNVNVANCTIYIYNTTLLHNFTNTSITQGTQSYTYSFSSDGSYSWNVTCFDTSGNSNSSATWSLTVDTTDPITNISLSGTQGWNGWYTSNVTINFTVTETNPNRTTYNLTGNWTNFTSSFSYGVEGNSTIQFYSLDAAGNQESTQSQNFGIDKTDPVLNTFNITPTNDSTINSSQNVTVTVNITDTNAYLFTLYVNGSATTNYTYNSSEELNITWTDAASFVEQTVTFSIVAYDLSGRNVSSSTLQLFINDTTPPNVTLVSPSLGSFSNTSSATFTYNATDTLSLSSCTIEIHNSSALVNSSTNSSVSNGLQTYTITLSDSVYYWNATCSDASNNTASSATWNFTIDTTAPSITVVETGTAGLNGWNTSNILINLTASDSGSGINTSTLQYRKSVTDSWTTYSTPFNMTKSGTLYYQVDDNAGLSTSGNRTYQIDKYAPTTTPSFNGSIAGSYYTTEVNVTLTAEETEASGKSGINLTNYSINGGSWITYTSPFNISTTGDYNISVRSMDNAGNLETTTNHSISLDLIAPDITASPSSGSNVSGTQTILIQTSASDSISVAWYMNSSLQAVNSTPNGTNYTFTWDTTAQSDGLTIHQFIITDTAGWTNSTTTNFTVDNTAPTVTISSPAVGTKYNTTPIMINGSVSADADEVSVRINSGSWLAATRNGTSWNYSHSNVTQGVSTIEIRANDTLGQMSDIIQTSVLFDNLTPSISSIIISPDPANNQTSNFTVTATITDTNGVTSVSANLNGSQTTLTLSGGVYTGTVSNTLTLDGTYNMTISAIDSFGNNGSANSTVTINNSVPSITFSKPHDSMIANGSNIAITVAAATNASYNVSRNGTVILNDTYFTTSTTYQITGNEANNITINVMAVGATTNATSSVNYTVDATVPSVTVLTTNNSYTTASTINVTGNVSDTNLVTVLINNETASLSGNDFWRVVTLPEGNNSITITAYDNASQTDSATIYVFRDSVAPTTSFTITGTSGSNGWYTSNVTVNFSVVDPSPSSGAYTQVYNGSQWINATNYNFTEGTTTITFRGSDNAGNVESNRSLQIKIDLTAPNVTGALTSAPLTPEQDVDSVTISTNVSGGVSGTLTVTDPDGATLSYNFTVDGNYYYYSFASLATVGSYQVTAVVYDIAGNNVTQYYNLSVVEIVSVQNIESEANETVVINQTTTANVTIDLQMNSSISDGEINITLSYQSPFNESLNDSVKYLTFDENTAINGSLVFATIKIYYTDEEIRGLDESALRMYWYNESSNTWFALNSSMDFVNDTGVNTTGNYIWAIVTHFSSYSFNGDQLACTNNAQITTACYYNGVLYTSGYICSGSYQASSCSSGGSGNTGSTTKVGSGDITILSVEDNSEENVPVEETPVEDVFPKDETQTDSDSQLTGDVIADTTDPQVEAPEDTIVESTSVGKTIWFIIIFIVLLVSIIAYMGSRKDDAPRPPKDQELPEPLKEPEPPKTDVEQS